MEGGILADSTQTPGAGPSRSPSISSASTASSHSRVESRKGKSPQRNGERSANPTKDDSSSDRRFVRSPRHTGDNIGVAAASVRSEESEDGDDDGPDEDDAGDGAEGGDDEEEDEEEDEDDDDDEGDEGDEGDEEEEEPTLKYSKMKGKMPEILAKDTASTIEVGSRMIAVGTHMGMVHVVSHEGIKINSFRPHAASVTCLRIDEESDFIATASVEGRVVIHSLTSTESYAFDYKRPMRALALEPGFGKKTSRSFVCGGMAGNLILQEKGWLGYKEQVLHSGEGPIWAVEWRNNIIAWANDTGVKLYDTTTGQRIGYIDRGAHAPRAELFKCSMIWKDDHTLVIAWADYIKVVRIRARGKTSQNTGLPALTVELTSIFQVDCMISGIATYGPTSFLVLAYVPPDSYTFDNEATDNPQEQKRKAANRPELRIIDKGEEISADALSLQNFHLYGCNDYTLATAPIPVPTSTSPKPNTVRGGGTDDLSFFVVSPSDIIVVRPRDEADHIEWLVDQERYEEALAVAEVFKQKHGGALDIQAIGRKYMKHLVHRDEFERAAGLAAKVFQRDTASWRECIEEFIRHDQLKVLVNEIPTKEPVLEKETYMTVLSHLLLHDKELLLRVIRAWPRGIYNIEGAAETIQGELRASDEDPLLIESMGELYLTNQQPGKALPYFLRLRQPRVFDLVREYSLFADVQDQAVLLVELDDESKQDGAAIKLLVDHTDSIPIERVVRQLERKPEFLLRYLQGIFAKDAPLSFPYSDRYIDLAATYKAGELMPFLRASNMYDLEKAYNTCKDHDLVPEMVFLLGRMGNNRQALMLIIQRLGDVQMAIDFAREQADEDLWEDLLEYSETRPDFIRTLLEHVGAEINPIRLISRIRDGMEIPGLKAALIKIVQASNLQVSLSEGCNRILSGDCAGLASRLQKGQVGCVQGSPQSVCAVCHNEAFKPGPSDTTSSTLVLVYLCRHTVHASCALLNDDIELPSRQDNQSVNHLLGSGDKIKSRRRELGSKLSFAASVRVRVGKCPVCKQGKGDNDTAGQIGSKQQGLLQPGRGVAVAA